jgi:hypothetical protein
MSAITSLSPIAALATIAVLAMPAGASARSTDRDHDHMPDRWEVAHHLNSHRNDARKDADRDGLKNLAEYRAQTDPRDADTDDDGLKDGKEQAGTITSFTGGVLTLTLFDGSTLTASVTDQTEIECPDAPAAGPAPATVRDRRDDEADDDAPAAATAPAPATAPATSGEDDHQDGDREHGDDDQGESDDNGCDATALVPGARVDEADIVVTSAGKVFHKVELG